MGNIEKLILLAVLFAAAVVLAVTLNKSGAGVEASNPMDALEQAAGADEPVGLRAPAAPAGLVAGEKSPAADPAQEPTLLLHAGATTEERAPAAASAAPAPESTLADGRILRGTAGLEPSFLDEYMLYTAVAGDTWAGLAQRFYQDGRYTRNLHLANEGLADLKPGVEILVPVYDFLKEDGERAPLAAEAAPAGATAAPLAVDVGGATSPAAALPGREYEVQSGDSLSEIALAVYGNGARWKEIFDANRDTLETPDRLQVGMKLRIPGASVAPVSLAARSAAVKPTSAKAAPPKPAKSTKKNRVQ